jgi:iron complex outermembrane receptor protein
MSSFSQQLDTLTYNLSEVTVSSSIRATDKTPISFTDIKQSEIKAKSFGQEMPQFLSKSSSMTFYSDAGSMSGYSYMRMRGIDNVRINFTLNGVPLNEPEDQGAYFNNYVDFLNNVESVQIQRGVGTSTNGVASYGGSVNFQSKAFVKNSTDFEILMGSYNTSKFTAGLSQKFSDNIYFQGRVSNLTTDGYRNNSENKSSSAFGNIMYLSKENMIQFLTFYGKQQNQMAYLATSVTDLESNPRTNYLSPDERDDFDYYFNQLQYSRQVTDELVFNTSAYYIHQKGNYDVIFGDKYNFRLMFNLYGGLVNVNYKSTDYEIDLGVHANSYERNHSMGLNNNTTENFYLNSGHKNELSSFVKFSYVYKSVVLFTDLQYRHVTFNYTPEKSYNLNFNQIDWNFFNPKVGVTLNQNEVQYYASLGVMHREPTRNDMFNGADDIDATNYSEVNDFTRVKPEFVVDTELGVKFSNKDYYLNANVFNMNFTNEIAQIGQLSYIGLPLKKNVESSNRYGVELDGKLRVSKRLDVSGNFTWMKGNIDKYTRDYDNTTFTDVEPLLTPNVLSNVSITYDLGLKVSIDAKYIGKSYLDNENTQTVPTALVFDLRSDVKFGDYNFRVVWNNVFNKTYYSSGYVTDGVPYYFIQSPSNVYVSLKLEL